MMAKGYGVPFRGDERILKWLHVSVSILKSIEWYTLNGRVAECVSYTLIKPFYCCF